MSRFSEPAAPDPLQVWCAQVPTRFDNALLQAYLALLSDAEREQLARLRFDRLKRRYLITRALVRTVLSRHAPIAPAAWSFAQNAFGRPFIADPPAEARGLQFNLSHTEALVVLVVGRGREVGIDVECTQRHAPLDVAQRYFSPAESAALSALPPASQAARFWDLWTLKESYLKARGMGLSLPLDAFTVRFDDAQLALDVEPRAEDPGSGWHLWQFALPGDHLLALCAQQLGGPAPRCEFRLVEPLRDEQPLALSPLRVSSAQA